MKALVFFATLLSLSSAIVEHADGRLDQSVTCAGYACCEGYTLRSDASSVTCVGGCSVPQCCVPTCAAPTFSCNPPSVLKSNPQSITCTTRATSISTSLGATGYICTQSRCCQSVTPSTCASFTCTGRSVPKPSTTTCVSSTCRFDECCIPLAPNCFTEGSPVPSCTGGRVARADAASVICGAGCTESQCCWETCNSAPRELCGSRPLNLAVSSRPCAAQSGTGNQCSADECCLTTCASDTSLRCGPGTRLRIDAADRLCASFACTTQECCVEDRPQCPASYPCNSPDVPKKLPRYCESSPCSYDDCCCKACNYCGTRFKGACPVGARLLLDVDCGQQDCTADLCCVGSCVNYPCPDGPSDPILANAQCANTKQCSQDECCKRWDD